MTKQYNHSVLGGTFDHLHEGHKAVIDKAFEVGKHVTIGLASDEFSQRKLLHQIIEPYNIRLNALTTYLFDNNYLSRATIIKLEDIFGPTLTDSSMDVIIVTTDTRQNAEIINELRKGHGLSPLELIEVPFVKGASKHVIRSTRIRRGHLDRKGFPYEHLFTTLLKMPDNLKESLRQPLGVLINGGNESKTAHEVISIVKQNKPIMTIAIGDITAISLMKEGFSPDIAVIDGKTKRKKIDKPLLASGGHVENQPGTINPLSVFKLSEGIEQKLTSQKNQIVRIDGEEDLLALPAILLSPLTSVVMYGISDKGIVLVEVSEQSKSLASKFIKKFIQSK